ncbi:glutathione S-transferase family protein [Altererythrobacter sp.]|uniref:glutathione S-transferase family protein n=1 Tax=Altererythrobacter sp. TaxID=1872480 RepID=UPI003D03D4AF
MLKLYGHPFSSYTWKALIPLYANGTKFEFGMVDGDHLDNVALVQSTGPHGKFPVLVDGETTVFEATSIIEYLDLHWPGAQRMLPDEPCTAIMTRMIDRVFDNYVMNVVQGIVEEYIRDPEDPNPQVIEGARKRLDRTYGWIENWLATYDRPTGLTLIECGAAPSLFYADWVHQIGDAFPRLQEWRAHLLALPPVSRCVEDARPYRHLFPRGAPDRD